MRLCLTWLLLAGLVAGGLEAQESSAQAAIMDSIAAQHRIAISRRRNFDDSLTQARQVLDTVRAGPLTMFVSPGSRRLADEALRLALDSLAPLGDQMVAALQGMRFVARRGLPPTWNSGAPIFLPFLNRPPQARPISVTVLDHNNVEQHQYWDQSAQPHLVAAYVTDHSRRRLASLLDPSLGRWVGGALGAHSARFDTVSTFVWTQLRLDLVSATSPMPRRCYEGSLRDCRHVLGLDSVRSPVRDYYDAAGRRYIVQRHAEQLRRRDYANTQACLSGADPACVSVLERSF